MARLSCVIDVMYIATRCRTEEQFLATYERYVTNDALFVATLANWTPGRELPFVYTLVNRQPVLRGIAYVRATWTTSASPFGLPGMLLGIRSLAAGSWERFERMRAGKAARRSEPRVSPTTECVSPRSELDIFSSPTRVDHAAGPLIWALHAQSVGL